MNGKLIVIDGLDGSGKSTQAEILYQALKKAGRNVKLISYPDYAQPSSALVKMYLNGEFSKNADDINAYAASTFYAVDRYAGYMQFWGNAYREGTTIIASRYVSSNAIHQMVKLDRQDWDQFLAWLSDYEYEKLTLPRPDQVIFLDMSRKVADRLISKRYHGDQNKKDIHESNMEYLQKCMESAHYAAQREHWTVIPCCNGQEAFPVEQIAEQLLCQVNQIL